LWIEIGHGSDETYRIVRDFDVGGFDFYFEFIGKFEDGEECDHFGE
jgi:hypothetical protein